LDETAGDPDSAPTTTGQDRPIRPAPSPRTLWLIMTPLAILIVISIIGDSISPSLKDSHPLLLMAMNARNRILLLVVNKVGAVEYYVVGTLRLLLSDPLFYLLGWFYGHRAIEWAEHRSSSAATLITQLERWFRYAAYPLVAIAPNNIICLLAGASGMRPRNFFAVNIAGTLVRLFVIREFAGWAEDQVTAVDTFITDYRPWFLAFTIGAALFAGWGEFRDLGRLPSELDDDADADESSATENGATENDSVED
jgi:membrane protein DedA with SNARE-associated domain